MVIDACNVILFERLLRELKFIKQLRNLIEMIITNKVYDV